MSEGYPRVETTWKSGIYQVTIDGWQDKRPLSIAVRDRDLMKARMGAVEEAIKCGISPLLALSMVLTSTVRER